MADSAPARAVDNEMTKTIENMADSAPARAAALRETFERDGAVCIRQAIPKHEMDDFRQQLEDVFLRKDSETVGSRTDMTAAAEQKRKEGVALLEDSGKGSGGKYLTEIEAGRFHKGIRSFEHFSQLPAVVGNLLGTKVLRFFGDHIFLKEPGSNLQTGFHQDMPYFPWTGDQAAVCWVPVDSVTRESGTMRYVKGSHRWAQMKPQLLITKEAANPENSAPDIPTEAELYANHEVLSWDVEPGDVIIHHPNMVHGSYGNTSVGQRRLAASIRYVGDDVRWHNKNTNEGLGESLMKNWAPVNEALKESVTASREDRMKALLAAGPDVLKQMDEDTRYQASSALVQVAMRTGDPMDANEAGRAAYPIVWQQDGGGAVTSRL